MELIKGILEKVHGALERLLVYLDNPLKRVDAVAGRVQVRRSVGKKDSAPETTSEELIPAQVFESPHATVSCGMGITVNLGSYESARVDVHVSIPCYPAETEQAYTFVRTFCEERIRQEVKTIKGGK